MERVCCSIYETLLHTNIFFEPTDVCSSSSSSQMFLLLLTTYLLESKCTLILLGGFDNLFNAALLGTQEKWGKICMRFSSGLLQNYSTNYYLAN